MTTRARISAKQRLAIFVRHAGECHLCGGKINAAVEAWEVSHEIPLELGGSDDDTNRLPAHKKCHRAHTSNTDIPAIAKAHRREIRHLGAKAPSRHSFACSRSSRWKKRLDGAVVRRDAP